MGGDGMSRQQDKQSAYLSSIGFTMAEIERLAADRTRQGIAAVAGLLARDSDMRRVVREIRQADPEIYANLRIVA